MPQMQSTALPACAPRVRSIRLEESCGVARRQPRWLLRPRPRLLAARALSTAAAPAAGWPAATIAVTTRTLATLGPAFATRSARLRLRHFFRTRHKCFHREAKTSTLVPVDELHAN